jgi:hypothetical protein
MHQNFTDGTATFFTPSMKLNNATNPLYLSYLTGRTLCHARLGNGSPNLPNSGVWPVSPPRKWRPELAQPGRSYCRTEPKNGSLNATLLDVPPVAETLKYKTKSRLSGRLACQPKPAERAKT